MTRSFPYVITRLKFPNGIREGVHGRYSGRSCTINRFYVLIAGRIVDSHSSM